MRLGPVAIVFAPGADEYAGGGSSGTTTSVGSGCEGGTLDLPVDPPGRLGGTPGGEANDCELEEACPGGGDAGDSNGFEFVDGMELFSDGGSLGARNGFDMLDVGMKEIRDERWKTSTFESASPAQIVNCLGIAAVSRSESEMRIMMHIMNVYDYLPYEVGSGSSPIHCLPSPPGT